MCKDHVHLVVWVTQPIKFMQCFKRSVVYNICDIMQEHFCRVQLIFAGPGFLNISLHTALSVSLSLSLSLIGQWKNMLKVPNKRVQKGIHVVYKQPHSFFLLVLISKLSLSLFLFFSFLIGQRKKILKAPNKRAWKGIHVVYKQPHSFSLFVLISKTMKTNSKF